MLELMVTLSIVAILAVMGVPIYGKYRLRSKVAAMVSAASAARLAVANDYFNQGYTFTNTDFAANSQPFLVSNANFIDSLYVTNGWVYVIGNAANLDGNQIDISFEPTVSNNSITWTCHIDAAFYVYAPEECRN